MREWYFCRSVSDDFQAIRLREALLQLAELRRILSLGRLGDAPGPHCEMVVAVVGAAAAAAAAVVVVVVVVACC